MGTISLNAATDVNRISERDLQSGFLEEVKSDIRPNGIRFMKELLRGYWRLTPPLFAKNIDKLNLASGWSNKYEPDAKAVFLFFSRLEEISAKMDGELEPRDLGRVEGIVFNLLSRDAMNNLANEKFYAIAKNFIVQCIEKKFMELDRLKLFQWDGDPELKTQILKEIVLTFEPESTKEDSFKKDTEESTKKKAQEAMAALQDDVWSTSADLGEKFSRASRGLVFLEYYLPEAEEKALVFKRIEELTSEIGKVKREAAVLERAKLAISHICKYSFRDYSFVFFEDAELKKMIIAFMKKAVSEKIVTLEDIRSYQKLGTNLSEVRSEILAAVSPSFKDGLDDSLKSQAKNFISWLRDERWTPLDVAEKFSKLQMTASFLSYYQPEADDVALFFKRMRELTAQIANALEEKIKAPIQGIGGNMFKDDIIVCLENSEFKAAVINFIKKAGTERMLTKENLRTFKAAGTSNGELRAEILSEVEASVSAASPEPKKKGGLLGGLLKKKS